MPKIIQNGISYSGISTPYFQEVSSVLPIGSTSITFRDESIESDSTIEVFIDPAFSTVMYSSATIVDGSITLTFPEQLSNIPIKVRIWLKGNAGYIYPTAPITELPAEYQKVKYLDFQGAYFTTTIPNVSYCLAKYDTSESSSYEGQGVFGYRTSSSNTQDWYVGITTNSATAYFWSRSNSALDLGDVIIPAINTPVEIQGIINTTRTDAYIGLYYLAGSTTKYRKMEFYGKLYYLKGYTLFTQNYTKIPLYDYVPCYRKSDNQVGLYELVEGNFLTPILLTVDGASGTITAGPDEN